jgi:hypothetical protein
MGGQISKMMGKIFGSKEMRLLMLGLDAAGKTSKSMHTAFASECIYTGLTALSNFGTLPTVSRSGPVK